MVSPAGRLFLCHHLSQLSSSSHLHAQLLLALTQEGVSREDAYSTVQRNAMESWKTGTSYRDLLKADADVVRNLGEDGIDALFNLDQHFRHVDTIFARVFGAASQGWL